MDRHMIKSGSLAGAVSGLALAYLQWAAYLLNILPYHVYIAAAGIILPENLLFSVFGLIVGFVLHTAFFALVGLLLAYVVHHRLEKSVFWGIGFGPAALVLSTLTLAWLAPEQPLWAMTNTAIYFNIISYILYGAFLGYLYKRYMSLPVGRLP
ncbi:hypothetical protein [Dethiobacter alkaliphilus]|uniref:Uncharacterized protein n=1 Tax=Dethiobacter alkaliphilus AHT 1 TaxID=555088 RepID=C0GK62_DETAL|nr:hypothetical protein [Dethiobacter alkaliphilus]EEG76245.1 hypothetical protein DealDRAFT_2871 [Dethiobacter alkaliphilus AHT 1]